MEYKNDRKNLRKALAGGECLRLEKKKCYCLAEGIYPAENFQ